MGWRFRKSFSPLPGVRLTFSPRGLTTSVGVGPLRITSGSHGVAATARIPGTGISYHQRLGEASPDHQALAHALRESVPEPRIIEKFTSSGTSEMTSPGLAAMKELLARAFSEQKDLNGEITKARTDYTEYSRRYRSWANGWLLKKLRPGKFKLMQIATEESKAKLDELEEQERFSRLKTDIDLPEGVRRTFSQLSDAFATMSKSERIWDVLSHEKNDRIHTRSIAETSADRRPVNFELNACGLIESEWKVPRLKNAIGGDIFLYPGFAVYFISEDAFALIDAGEIEIQFIMARFIEEEAVPRDATVTGQTWKKANKDGSQDRRFAGNYQIPIVKYGYLHLKTPSGLNEAYMFSNFESVDAFMDQWAEFQKSITEAHAAASN